MIGSGPQVPAIIEVAGLAYHLERATADDLPALVALLTDDPLGSTRETPDPAPYAAAFAAIDADPAHLLLVARDAAHQIVATMQLTLIPCLARAGATRLQIEAVRVGAGVRGRGLGAALIAWAHDWGRERGAALAQLTSDQRRPDAHRFYERLGYVASHTGFKRSL
ncbi:GNAT family N-acetyltransferase [Granulicoccus sp. GXG6511]|uniref:GNAT family N-acetyltransferase n=1 Tax=Granulicoccus sp. GXG6511 TaxID=3381351 RepID=UPI003D7EC122